MNNLNTQLRNGILPRELQYNSHYHSYDFYANKFPRNWGDAPLFIPLINIITNTAKMNNLTPLHELNNMSNNSIDNNESDTSQ
jgi:hypothetical protein